MTRPKTRMVDDGSCRVKVVHLPSLEQARAAALPDGQVRRLAALFKVLGDPTRIRMLHALSSGEMCVCDLAALTGTSDSAVSHHLRRFKDLELVRSRRDGPVIFYRLHDDHVERLLQLALTRFQEPG